MSENKMTPLPWRTEIYGDGECRDQIISDVPGVLANLVCSSPDPDLESYHYFAANASAIVLAINKTFGAGIDPNWADEMLKALESIIDCAECEDGWISDAHIIRAKTVIKNAKLDKNESK